MAPKQNPKTTSSATSQPSKSSEIVASNDDLLKQILLKLPLKPLVKFTSVSKHWLSLISGPDFSHYGNPSCSVSGLFIESFWDITVFDFVDLNQSSDPSNEQPRIPFRSISFLDNSSKIKILQSCNGLLICSTNKAREPKEYYIDNPTTRTYAILPPLPFPYRSVWGMNLAFEPSKSSHYKVVCVLSQTIDDHHDNGWEDADDTQIAIYSSETHTWRLSGDSFYSIDAYVFSKGVFWNGSLHWLDMYEHLYFNVDEERLTKMPLPPDRNPDPDPDLFNLSYFVESGGHLYLIYQLLRCRALPGFHIFEMKTDYSHWFLKFRVDLSEFPTMFLETYPNYEPDLDLYFFKIVHIVGGDVDEESYAVITIPGMVIKYNFECKEFHKLCEIEAGKGATDYALEWGDTQQYIESLAPV